MTTTTNGKWSIAHYPVEEDGRESSRYRLIYDGNVVMDEVSDVDELLGLFAVSLISDGFAALAQWYHDKALSEDDGTLEYLGPSCCPVATLEILGHCRGDFAKLPMPDEVCVDLDLPVGSTYGEGVEQFWKGYRDHAASHRRSPQASPAANATDGAAHGTDAFFKELAEME